MRKSGDRPADVFQARDNRESTRRLSREEPTNMRTYVVCFFLITACLRAAVVKGKVVDPSGAPVPGAEISLVSRVGVEAATVSTAFGGFELNVPDVPDARLVVAAPGFALVSVSPAEAQVIRLEIAPRTETVQ